MDQPFLNDLDPSRAQIFFMRHAERFAITDLASSGDVLLTEKGKQDAHAFGKRIAGRCGPVRLYYSPVTRCRQTAEFIFHGIGEGGGDGSLEGPLSWLGGDFIRTEVSFVDGRIGTGGLDAFIREWFDDALPEDKITPPKQAARREAGFLYRQLDGAAAGLIIDITHDWNIMLLLEYYLGLRHEDVGFPPFLACLFASKSASGHLALSYGDTHIETDEWD